MTDSAELVCGGVCYVCVSVRRNSGVNVPATYTCRFLHYPTTVLHLSKDTPGHLSNKDTPEKRTLL